MTYVTWATCTRGEKSSEISELYKAAYYSAKWESVCLPWQPASVLQPLENTGPFIKGIISRSSVVTPALWGRDTAPWVWGSFWGTGKVQQAKPCHDTWGLQVWTSISRGAATSWVPVVFPWCSYIYVCDNDKSFGPLLIRLHAAKSCRAGTVSLLGAG